VSCSNDKKRNTRNQNSSERLLKSLENKPKYLCGCDSPAQPSFWPYLPPVYFIWETQRPAIANSGIEGLVILPNPGAGHQEGDIYDADEVPAGGVHNAQWQSCGIYDEPVREENVIHSMEHGAARIALRAGRNPARPCPSRAQPPE
jgi:hypothetical protein